MEKYIIKGGNQLKGTTSVSGAKNVALKAMVAACLTDEEVIIHNTPNISDVHVMAEIIKELGGEITIEEHTAKILVKSFNKDSITLDQASHIRTSSMFIAPLLARNKRAIIPNPGGCRLGARPIDRTIQGLSDMGAVIEYRSDDGYFHAVTEELHGTDYRFEKNTHTGTETMIIAAVLAKGHTVLRNAAAEPEIEELINLLTAMGAKIRRSNERTIEIEGVGKLHGAEIRIDSDRNEVVTLAIAAIVTKGDIYVKGATRQGLVEFLEKLDEVGGGYEEKEDGIRFFYKGELLATDVVTKPYPGFMTDWQAPWAVLMTQAQGESILHETVFENRFGYVKELKKMGANISLFNPLVEDPKEFYNFNLDDDKNGNYHAIRIKGPTPLHNAVVSISDLRAGASLVIAALAATGETTIHGTQYVKRGYEEFDKRLASLGATIKSIEEK